MDEAKTVWCGNLSDKVTEEILFELFLQVAPLERVKIPTDKEGRKSNFGFVTFKHEESVDYALQLLNGIRLFDKSLNIKPRNANSNAVNRFPERNVNYDPFFKSGNLSQPINFPNRDNRENRDDKYTSRNFRDNYRDDRHRNSPYNRHDDRNRNNSNRRKQASYDRRDNFNDRGNNRRGNRYY